MQTPIAQPTFDEIDEEDEEEEPVVTKKKKKKKKKYSGAAKQPKKVAPAGPKGGTLTIKVSGSTVTKVSLTGCSNARQSVRGGKAVFSNVPVEKCTLKFSPSGSFATIQGGQKTVTCTLKSGGQTVSCR